MRRKVCSNPVVTITANLLCRLTVLQCVLVASGCAPAFYPAPPNVHDIIPEKWIGHNGPRISDGDNSGNAIIFPSSPESVPTPAPIPAAHFLRPDNAIRNDDVFCIICGGCCHFASHPRITLKRNPP